MASSTASWRTRRRSTCGVRSRTRPRACTAMTSSASSTSTATCSTARGLLRRRRGRDVATGARGLREYAAQGRGGGHEAARDEAATRRGSRGRGDVRRRRGRGAGAAPTALPATCLHLETHDCWLGSALPSFQKMKRGRYALYTSARRRRSRGTRRSSGWASCCCARPTCSTFTTRWN